MLFRQMDWRTGKAGLRAGREKEKQRQDPMGRESTERGTS